MPRHRQSLNADVLREIFKYFVAVDKNGPFTLIILSTYWHKFIISSPSLWTYVHVDDEIPDLDARLETLTVLSANKPLHIIIRMPYKSLSRLHPLIQRCITLTIDKPASSDTTNIDEQNEVSELAQVVAKRLLRPLPSGLKQIFWYKSGNPTYFLLTESDMKLSTRDPRERYIALQSGYAGLPPLMITSLSISVSDGLGSKNLHFILSRFRHLQDLQMDFSVLSEPWNVGYVPIELPFLQTISVRVPRLPVSGAFLDILSHIRAPKFEMATIRGLNHIPSGFETASLLIVALRPRSISLDFEEDLISLSSGTFTTSHSIRNLQSITTLRIKFSREVSGQAGYNVFHRVNHFLQALPGLQSFRLYIPGAYLECLKVLSIPRGVFVVSISPKTYSWSRSDPDTDFDIGNPPQIDQLEISSDISLDWRAFWCKELSSARAIIVPGCATLNYLPRNVLIDPRYWSNRLTRLDLGHFCFSPEVSRSDSIFVDLQPFNSLTEVRCTLEVISPLLSRSLLPSLKDLILLPSDRDWGINAFTALLLNMINPPPLQTLGFLFYPEWKQLYRITQQLLKMRSTRDLFSIKLPGLPHPNLLAQLITALRGETPLHSSELVTPACYLDLHIIDEDGDSYMNDKGYRYCESIDKGCLYCERSGWVCKEQSKDIECCLGERSGWNCLFTAGRCLSCGRTEKERREFCDRHSLGNLVTITQYTLS